MRGNSLTHEYTAAGVGIIGWNAYYDDAMLNHKHSYESIGHLASQRHAVPHPHHAGKVANPGVQGQEQETQEEEILFSDSA